jgi:hypothetical protein
LFKVKKFKFFYSFLFLFENDTEMGASLQRLCHGDHADSAEPMKWIEFTARFTGSNIMIKDFFGRTRKQPVSKRQIMKFKKPNLANANTPEIKTASFKTAKIHNAYIQNAQYQKAQFFCIATSF